MTENRRPYRGLGLEHAGRLRQQICQYAMRPTYAEKILERSTYLKQGMKAQILSEIVNRAKVPLVWIAERVTKTSTIPCSGREVSKFLEGKHGDITPEIFRAVIHCVVCGSHPEGNPDFQRLNEIASDIYGFFIHPDERAQLPAFFQSPRAFVPSPFDYAELAMAIRWMNREALNLGTTGTLVFTAFEDSFPQSHSQVMAATKEVIQSAAAAIRVEFLFPQSQSVPRQSVDSMLTALAPASSANVAVRPLPDRHCIMLSPFVSHVYRAFETPSRDEKVFIVRNDWTPELKEPLTWVASHEHTKRFSLWLKSLPNTEINVTDQTSSELPDDQAARVNVVLRLPAREDRRKTRLKSKARRPGK